MNFITKLLLGNKFKVVANSSKIKGGSYTGGSDSANGYYYFIPGG